LNGARVGKVLRSPRSKLSGDKIVRRNKAGREAAFRVNHAFNAPFPCRVKIDARKIGKNIEAARVAPKTKKAAAVGKFLRSNALERCTELGKRIVCRLRISGVSFYEKVDVLRKARLRMKDHSVTANNQVLTPWAWKADKRSL